MLFCTGLTLIFFLFAVGTLLDSWQHRLGSWEPHVINILAAGLVVGLSLMAWSLGSAFYHLCATYLP